jgi:hypothetical protein
MPKRSSITGHPQDENQLAKSIVDELTISEDEQEPLDEKNLTHLIAVALGRRGGKKGGPARAAKLSAKRRKAIAKKAAEARWAKQKAQD